MIVSSSPPATRPAQRIGNRYELLEQLGRGSSATVYAALDRRFNRRVVLKLFDPAIGADPDLRARFRQQTAKAARLVHQNIAAILDAGFTDDLGAPRQPFVVSEPAGDQTLRSRLDRGGALSARRAIQIVRQVAAALEHAHRQGVVHADVKPENVVLDDEGGARLVDFSLSFVSARTGAVTRETIARRAAYLAPEQVRGQAVSSATDVYALGVLLYEMLVGRPPFIGDSPRATAERRVYESPRPAGLFEPSISPELESVIGRGLEREPDRRWPSVQAFIDALGRLGPAQLEPRQPGGTAGPELAAPHRLPRLASRWASLSGLVPTLAVALALGLTLVYLVPALRGGLSIGALLPSKGVVAPNVVGMTAADARKEARARGLELLVIGDRVTERMPQGQIIQQSPVAGFEASGQPLRVTVSAGVTVPDVRGMSYENAVARLRDLGWRVGKTERRSYPGNPAGTVALQWPGPGEVASAPGELLLAVAE